MHPYDSLQLIAPSLDDSGNGIHVLGADVACSEQVEHFRTYFLQAFASLGFCHLAGHVNHTQAFSLKLAV